MTSMEVTTRIESALDRIRTVVASGQPVVRGDREQALARENAELQDQLSELREQRDNDLAELDGLVAQLKPLIGEV